MSLSITTEDTREIYWQQQIQAWTASGKSQKAFCEEMNLSYHRFGYWRRKFCQDSAERTKTTAFVPVTRQLSATTLSLSLPNGLVIEGIAENNVFLVGELLGQL